VNSSGLDLANEHRLASLSSALLNSALHKWQAKPILEQPVADGEMQPVVNPAEPKDVVGYVREASEQEVSQAIDSAVNNAPIWFATPPQERAAILERAAVLMEDQMQLIGILVREAVKPSATPLPKCAKRWTSCIITPARFAMILITKHTARLAR
jgi:RHH-type proline utilization regulon transcriptional repressor/proline dehydrogenase/delta 1-pyrroline-5-carboxylate dehydrogenase